MHHFGIIIQFENQRSQRSIPPSRPRGFSSPVYQETVSSLLFCLSVTGADLEVSLLFINSEISKTVPSKGIGVA